MHLDTEITNQQSKQQEFLQGLKNGSQSYADTQIFQDLNFLTKIVQLTKTSVNLQERENAWWSLWYILRSKEVKNNRENMLAAVAINGIVLAYLSREFRSDNEIVGAALKENKLAINFASKAIIFKNIQNDAIILNSILEEFKNDASFFWRVWNIHYSKENDQARTSYISWFIINKIALALTAVLMLSICSLAIGALISAYLTLFNISIPIYTVGLALGVMLSIMSLITLMGELIQGYNQAQSEQSDENDKQFLVPAGTRL